ERDRSNRVLMLHGEAEGATRRRVPEPRRMVETPRQDGLAVRAEGDTKDHAGVGENGPEPGVMVLPGRQAGAGRVLPSRVIGCRGRAPALSQQQQPRPDLPFLAVSLAALEVEDGEPSHGLLQRRLELTGQTLRLGQ